MPPSPRPILNLTRYLFSEGPLIGRAPIGQFKDVGPKAKRRFSAFVSPCKNKIPRSKRWQDVSLRCNKSRQIGSGARLKSTWEHVPGGVATSPKRSNTGPLLGVLFGASALAYVGSSVFSHVDVQDNPIKSGDGINITDTDGKLIDALDLKTPS